MEEMMMLIERRGELCLVKWRHKNGREEYVICHEYDETKPMGSRWFRGEYFKELEDAVECFSERTK